MDKEFEKEVARELLSSMRGRFILSQALTIAIREMKKVKSPHTEISNIADMELLRKHFFYLFVEITPKQLKKLLK